MGKVVDETQHQIVLANERHGQDSSPPWSNTARRHSNALNSNAVAGRSRAAGLTLVASDRNDAMVVVE